MKIPKTGMFSEQGGCLNKNALHKLICWNAQYQGVELIEMIKMIIACGFGGGGVSLGWDLRCQKPMPGPVSLNLRLE